MIAEGSGPPPPPEFTEDELANTTPEKPPAGASDEPAVEEDEEKPLAKKQGGIQLSVAIANIERGVVGGVQALQKAAQEAGGPTHLIDKGIDAARKKLGELAGEITKDSAPVLILGKEYVAAVKSKDSGAVEKIIKEIEELISNMGFDAQKLFARLALAAEKRKVSRKEKQEYRKWDESLQGNLQRAWDEEDVQAVEDLLDGADMGGYTIIRFDIYKDGRKMLVVDALSEKEREPEDFDNFYFDEFEEFAIFSVEELLDGIVDFDERSRRKLFRDLEKENVGDSEFKQKLEALREQYEEAFKANDLVGVQKALEELWSLFEDDQDKLSVLNKTMLRSGLALSLFKESAVLGAKELGGEIMKIPLVARSVKSFRNRFKPKNW